MKKVLLALFAAAIMTSCGGDLTGEAADKMCECANAGLKATEDAAKASSSEELMAVSSEATSKMKECMEGAQEKYKGKVDGKDLQAAMKTKCAKAYEALFPGK